MRRSLSTQILAFALCASLSFGGLFIFRLYRPARAVHATPTFVQSCNAASNGAGPASCTLVGVGQHHLLVLAVYSCGAVATQYIAPDTFGLTYLGLTGGGPTNTGPFACNFRIRWVNIFTVDSGLNSGNDTITLNADGAITLTNSIIFAEYSLTLAQDGSSGFNSGGNDGPITITTAPVATAFNGDLLFAAGESSCDGLPACGTNTMTVGAGYTIRDSVTNTNDGNGAGFTTVLYLEDQIAGAAGNYTASFVQSLNAKWGWEIVLGAFKAQSVGGVRHKAQEY